MLNKSVAMTAIGGAFLMAVTAAAPASAAIQCQGRSQYNSAAGGWIPSPYCSDNLIAAVARSKGMNVSNKAVRQNVFEKDRACRFAGSDPRITDLCAGHLPGESRRRF